MKALSKKLKWILLFFFLLAPYFVWKRGIEIHDVILVKEKFQIFIAEYQILSGFLFIVLYWINSAFNFPYAVLLTLVSGFLFGFSLGFIYSSISSTLGGFIGFILARKFYREDLLEKYKHSLTKIEKMISKNEIETVLTLRLVPLFPFFLVNILLGLSPVRWQVFLFYSWIGMMPATSLFVYAGTNLTKIKSISDILSLELLGSLVLLGIFPWLVKLIYKKLN
jgi:uncharacterized membrane protein YdjX (TVP38/TMEM64 family)